MLIGLNANLLKPSWLTHSFFLFFLFLELLSLWWNAKLWNHRMNKLIIFFKSGCHAKSCKKLIDCNFLFELSIWNFKNGLFFKSKLTLKRKSTLQYFGIHVLIMLVLSSAFGCDWSSRLGFQHPGMKKCSIVVNFWSQGAEK